MQDVGGIGVFSLSQPQYLLFSVRKSDFQSFSLRAKNILVNKVNKTVWSTCRWRRRIQPQPASVFTFFHLKNVPGGLYWRLSPCIFSAFEGLVLSGLPHSVALPLHCDLKLRNIFRNCIAFVISSRVTKNKITN